MVSKGNSRLTCNVLPRLKTSRAVENDFFLSSIFFIFVLNSRWPAFQLRETRVQILFRFLIEFIEFFFAFAHTTLSFSRALVKGYLVSTSLHILLN